jgi:hypothetical protein
MRKGGWENYEVETGTYSYHEDEGPYGIGAVNLARIRD